VFARVRVTVSPPPDEGTNLFELARRQVLFDQ